MWRGNGHNHNNWNAEAWRPRLVFVFVLLDSWFRWYPLVRLVRLGLESSRVRYGATSVPPSNQFGETRTAQPDK